MVVDGKEPNKTQTVDDTIENFLDKMEAPDAGEQHEESSPQSEQSKENPEGESDSQKTQSTVDPDSFKGVDKGFNAHPKWIEREQKLKEAEGKARDLDSRVQSYSKLLDDPAVYRKWLELQGFSERQIADSLRAKGIDPSPQTQVGAKSEARLDMAESICKKLGWDIGALDAEQKTYLKDQIRLAEAVADEKLSEMKRLIDERLKPLEDSAISNQLSAKTEREINQAREVAKDEFKEDFAKDPQFWQKVIEPAMNKILDELDQKDPKRSIQMDAVTLYEKATRAILKERRFKEDRQEVRDQIKSNARPLTPKASTNEKKDSIFKGKTPSETADNFLDSLNVR